MNKYYAFGRVGEEFAHNGWPDEESAKTFYDVKNCELIKWWKIDHVKNEGNCGNARVLLDSWNKAEKIIEQIDEGKSIEEILKKLR